MTKYMVKTRYIVSEYFRTEDCVYEMMSKLSSLRQDSKVVGATKLLDHTFVGQTTLIPFEGTVHIRHAEGIRNKKDFIFFFDNGI